MKQDKLDKANNDRQVINIIRIYEEDDGVFKDTANEFDLCELADTVPEVGDFIIEPGVVVGKDRDDPANRDIYEVVSRYFMPNAHGDNRSYVAVVVKSRCATEKEAPIIWVC